MYSTKLFNKNAVEGNAYITVGDTYVNPVSNPFRQPKKGEKPPVPFQVKVSDERSIFNLQQCFCGLL